MNQMNHTFPLDFTILMTYFLFAQIPKTKSCPNLPSSKLLNSIITQSFIASLKQARRLQHQTYATLLITYSPLHQRFVNIHISSRAEGHLITTWA